MEVEAGPQALEILRTLMSEKKSTSREKYSIPCFVGLAIIKRVWVIYLFQCVILFRQIYVFDLPMSQNRTVAGNNTWYQHHSIFSLSFQSHKGTLYFYLSFGLLIL